jgi:hypothetical protein
MTFTKLQQMTIWIYRTAVTGIPGMEGILRRRDLPSINLQTTTHRSRPSIVHQVIIYKEKYLII